MYFHVLVPVAYEHKTKGPAALSVAETLLAEGGRITLLHVQEIVPSYVQSYVPSDIFETNRRETLDALKALAKGSKRHVETVIVAGAASRAIVDYASGHDVDCIVIASHQPQMADYLIGSTAAWVARHAECAVHILR